MYVNHFLLFEYFVCCNRQILCKYCRVRRARFPEIEERRHGYHVQVYFQWMQFGNLHQNLNIQKRCR